MLAFDHGYMMGSTAGLERMDVTIAPLCEYVDVLMGTRGALRACIPPTYNKAVVKVVHEGLTDKEAYQYYLDSINA